MRMKKINKYIALFISVCIILFSVLSIGFLFVHSDHDCNDHHSDHGCEICLHIESIINFGKEIVFTNVCTGSFVILLVVSGVITLSALEKIVMLTPVTLKVKMNN